MPRIIAVDYGLKRTGLAVSDPGKLIATPLDTVQSDKVIDFLTKYCKSEEVECIVVGEPRQMDNSASSITPHVEAFVKRLIKALPEIPVRRIDERFTSKLALQSLILSGTKKSERRNKELIDRTSAVIILQSFMEMNKQK